MCHQNYDTYLYHPPQQGNHRLYSTFATSGLQLTALLYWRPPPPPPTWQPYNTVDITHNWMQQWHTVHFVIMDFTYSTIITFLAQARWIHSTPRQPISLRHNLTLSSHLMLSSPVISFLELSSPKLDMYFLKIDACYMSHSSSLITWSIPTTQYVIFLHTISLAFHFQIFTTSVLHLGQGIKFHIHKMCQIIVALYLFNG